MHQVSPDVSCHIESSQDHSVEFTRCVDRIKVCIVGPRIVSITIDTDGRNWGWSENFEPSDTLRPGPSGDSEGDNRTIKSSVDSGIEGYPPCALDCSDR